MEECYYSDEDELVVNKNRKMSKESEEGSDDWDMNEEEDEEEDIDQTLEEIIKQENKNHDEEGDPAHELFENYPESEDEEDDNQDLDKKAEVLNDRVERHNENLQKMMKSNFRLKSKIDGLFEILQMQREKHRDLKQELTRMLSDIQ